MDIEVLNDLENKVTALISILEGVRQENATLKSELDEKSGKIASVESDNFELKKELDRLKEDSANQQEKINLTAEKIQGILSRLEMVQ